MLAVDGLVVEPAVLGGGWCCDLDGVLDGLAPFLAPFCGDAGGFSSSGSGNLRFSRMSAPHSIVLMQSGGKH